MVQISKEEAMSIRDKFGESACVTITNRHKKGDRKCYYTEETSRVTRFLDTLRKNNHSTKYEKRGT